MRDVYYLQLRIISKLSGSYNKGGLEYKEMEVVYVLIGSVTH